MSKYIQPKYVQPERLFCCHCERVTPVKFGIVIAINNSKNVRARCQVCGKAPVKNDISYPSRNFALDTLEVLYDYTIDNDEPCCVRGCENKAESYRHFAPRHLFDNPDDWPVGGLCNQHHDEWHRKVTPNMCEKNHEQLL